LYTPFHRFFVDKRFSGERVYDQQRDKVLTLIMGICKNLFGVKRRGAFRVTALRNGYLSITLHGRSVCKSYELAIKDAS